MAGVADLVARLSLDAKQADAAIQQFSSKIQGMSQRFRTAGMAAGIAGGAIVGALGMAAKSAADFEGGMREVNSMMGLGQQEFQALSNDVLKLTKDLGVDAVDATKALYQAISAGVPKENVLTFMEVATKAAIAGVTDTETAVDGLTTVINAFKMDVSDAQKVADIMFQTVKGGKTTFEELSASLFNVAPIAKASGVSFEEVAAALATMTKQGVPTSVATTQLRAAIQALSAPTVRQEKHLQSLGLEMSKEALQAKGLAGTMAELMDATGGNMAVLRKLIGSVEGVQAVLALAGENAETYAADLDAVRHATDGVGAATDAFNEINKGAARQLEIMKNKMGAVGITIGNMLLPKLMPLIDTLTRVVDGVSDWVEQNPELSTTLFRITGIVGLLGIGLAGIVAVLPAVIAGFAALNAIMSGNPVLMLVTGVALLAGGIYLLTQQNDEAEKSLARLDITTRRATESIDALAGAEYAERMVKAGLIEDWQMLETATDMAAMSVEDYAHGLTAAEQAQRSFNQMAAQIYNQIQARRLREHVEQQLAVTMAAMQVYDPTTGFYEDPPTTKYGEGGLQGGGLVHGRAGQPVPIIAHGGERVLTRGQSREYGGGQGLTVIVQGSVITERELGNITRKYLYREQDRNFNLNLS